MAYYCATLFIMKTFSLRLILGLSLLISRPLFALSLEEIKVADVSSSGQSILVDTGELESLKEGTFGRFYVQTGPITHPVIFLVAEGELVKAFPRKSYWLMRKVHLPEQIKKSASMLLLSSDAVSQGRPLKIKTRTVVASSEDYRDVDDFLAQNKENVPDRLIREANNYETSEEMFEADPVPEADVEVATYEGFKNKSQTYYSEEYGDLTAQRYFIGNTEVRLGDIKKAEDKKLLDSMGKGYEQQVANMKYGVKDFYRNQEKLPGMREFNKSITVTSTYDQVREEKKRETEVSPRALAKKERDGENWSADLDTQSLRKYFISTGLEREVRRRELALNELDGHEIMFHYSGSVIDQSSASDPNYRGLGYQLGLGYELHLSRTGQEWKQWSLQFILERGVVDTDIGGVNGRSEEGFYGGYLNYYFLNNPLTLNSLIGLVGVGMKIGAADISSPDMSKEYSFRVLNLPSVQLLSKYRFRTGDLAEDTVNIGASANFGMQLDFKRYTTNDILEDNINGKFSNTDLKYYLGMSVYF